MHFSCEIGDYFFVELGQKSDHIVALEGGCAENSGQGIQQSLPAQSGNRATNALPCTTKSFFSAIAQIRPILLTVTKITKKG